MKKLEIRVHQHAPIFPMARLSRGLIFHGNDKFWDIGDFWDVQRGVPEVKLCKFTQLNFGHPPLHVPKIPYVPKLIISMKNEAPG